MTKGRILEINNPKQGVNSVSSSSAQAVELCSPVKQQLFDYGEVMSKVLKVYKANSVEAAIIEVMVLSGSRIQQVLNVSPKNVTVTGVVIIPGAKGGSSVRCVPILTRDFWFRYASKMDNINKVYSRFYFYRLFKKLGFYYVGDKGHNNSVTHCFRVSSIKETKGMSITESERAKMFGHNSNTSQQYYLSNGKSRV